MSGNLQKEFGDYQTPLDFALLVCNYIKECLEINPSVIVEPTCGVGNFVNASLNTFSSIKKVYGIDINEEYTVVCKENNKNDDRVEIICNNFFTFDTKKLAKGTEDVLVIGNPPWAMNSDLNFNLPDKINFKNLSGMDAITGGSNFDICEYMILKLIEEFNNTNTAITMLCKTSVARNVLLELNRNDRHVEYVKMLKFNATKIFNIGASACLLVIKLSKTEKNYEQCEVMDIENPKKIVDIIKVKGGALSSAVAEVEDFEGECEFIWRQGVKHDCASVMELTKNEEGIYLNKKKEKLDIEDILVYPLIKSSLFKQPIIKDKFKKFVLVTQKKARQETGYIEMIAPKTWKYLNDNKVAFDKRKSSIYNGAPNFSMFGVGDYSYAKYKVGVSGFYKKALFCMVYNEEEEEHPVMGDDTSYFLAFDNKDIAYTCMLLLNSKKVQDFLFSISFQDAKRPYTKKVLQRISLKKASDVVSLQELVETEDNLKLEHVVTDEMYNLLKKELVEYQLTFTMK